MKTAIKKILKESIEKKHLFGVLKQIDKLLTNRDWKEDFFGEQGGRAMGITYEVLFEELLNKFGYSAQEAHFILGSYFETFDVLQNDKLTDPEQIILPTKSKYLATYDVRVRGRMDGRMTTGNDVYSPTQAAYNFHNYNWGNKTVDNDETEWDEFDMDIPYKVN